MIHWSMADLSLQKCSHSHSPNENFKITIALKPSISHRLMISTGSWPTHKWAHTNPSRYAERVYTSFIDNTSETSNWTLSKVIKQKIR